MTMSRSSVGAPHRIDGHDTPTKLLRARAASWAELPALRHKRLGIWQSLSWGEYFVRIRAIGLALAARGFSRGDVVGVLSENRPEWLIADLGAQCMGMIGMGVYPTSSPDQLAYALRDSGARALFVENDEQVDKLLQVRSACPGLELVVIFDDHGLGDLAGLGLVSFRDLLSEGLRHAASRAEMFSEEIDAGRPEDVAFIVYTSGTTASPKGAMISNANVMFQLGLTSQLLSPGEGKFALSFLPLCHIAERMGTVFNPMALGAIVHFPEDPTTLFNDLAEVAPYRLFGPPRFWEKLCARVELFMHDATPVARYAYRLAIAEGRALAEARTTGRSCPLWRRLRFAALDRFVLDRVRRWLGLGNIADAVTGAASVSEDLVGWYLAIGISLREAFGMTETTGYVTSTSADRLKIGRAGTAVPGVELRIGADDEIQVRGGNVCLGYWKKPRETADAFLPDGWFRTGDCGHIDADGFLKVTDRVKDIIITSSGKNIAPSSIENQLKFSPYISDALVIGEGRNYLTCLVMIDQENAEKLARDREVAYTDFASLARSAAIREAIGVEIHAVNSKLSRIEQIKDFRVIDRILTPEDEELTPTMKMKRRVAAVKYAQLIETMYPNSR